MNKWWIIASVILLVLSCSKDDEPATVDLGYDYQPLEIGYWLEYQVDSIFFNDFNDPPTRDTFAFELREYFESTFLDLNGDTNIRVEQSVRSEQGTSWVIRHIASYKRTSINLQKVEYDLRYVKFAFPPSQGKNWEGHIFINVIDQPVLEYLDRTRYNWNYTFSAVNQPLTISAFNFDSTATITQIDEENLFEKKFSEEIYAKNVGLVSKEMIILETQAPPSSVPFVDRAEKGFIVKYTLTDFKQ